MSLYFNAWSYFSDWRIFLHRKQIRKHKMLLDQQIEIKCLTEANCKTQTYIQCVSVVT